MINTELTYEAAAHSSSSQFTSNIMASSPVVTTAGSAVVVTHVIPAPRVAAPQNAAKKNKLRWGCLVALGTAQIVIGLMVFPFELAMIQCTDTLGIFSGAFIWGPLCSILSGCLTVAAETLNNYLVKGALGCSVVAAVSSSATSAIYCVDFFGATPNLPFYHCWSDLYDSYAINLIRTVSGVLAGVFLVEFIISVYVFLFLYEASRVSTDQQPIVIINQSHEAASQTPEPRPITQPPPTSEGGYETMRPVEYDTTIIYRTTPPLTDPTPSTGPHVPHRTPPPVPDPTSCTGPHLLYRTPPPLLDPTSPTGPHLLYRTPPPPPDPTSSTGPHLLYRTPPPPPDPTFFT